MECVLVLALCLGGQVISAAFLGCFVVRDKRQLTVWFRLSRCPTASGGLAQAELLRSFPCISSFHANTICPQ